MRKFVVLSLVLVLLTVAFGAAMAASESVVLTEVLAVDYDADNDNFYVVGVAPEGDIDVYYGYHNNWKKLQDNRDIDNRFSSSEFVDFAIGLPTGKFGAANNPGYAVVIGDKGGACTSINGREFYDKPWFGDGNPVAVGDLIQCLDIAYDANNDDFYVTGVGPGGDIDVWYGYHNTWTKLQENRDIDNRYAPAEFTAFAIGAEPGEAMFAMAIGNKGGACTSINGREFYDKPWFGDGSPVAVGTLAECLAIEYDADNNDYYVVGIGPEGAIDVWYGQHNNWTQLQENRDIDNRYTPAEFAGFAIGLPTGKFGLNYAIVTGNDAKYRVAWRTYDARGTSINGREFYDKPYFGDGKPLPIGIE